MKTEPTQPRTRAEIEALRWLPPDETRVPINIHPEAREALRRLLMDDPRLHGVGYSEFIMRAVRAYATERQ